MVARLARGQLAEIPGAGHDLGVEQPERVAAVVRDFLLAPRYGVT
jgi:pimeloyl-ACP methyl ester carboxylesterase